MWYTMINTAIIEHAVKLCIYSSIIENERPVSMILVAKAESGKTEILKKFSFIDEVVVTTDFNSFIFSDFAMACANGKKNTLIIPDFLRVVKKKYSTQSNSLMILNALTEEGWVGSLPMGFKTDKPIVANLITAITEDEMIDKRHRWAKLGFLSRFVPLSYSYSEKTKNGIREYIKDRVYHTDTPFKVNLPRIKQHVALPKDMANLLQHISLKISDTTNLTGFRLQRQLQTLAMANALSNGRNMVTGGDVETVQEIAKFINFNFTQV